MKSNIDLGNNNKPKNKLQAVGGWLWKHKLFTLTTASISVMLISFSMVGNMNSAKIAEEKLKVDSYRNKMLSEPHTRLQYFLELEEPNEDSLESAARLIAHTMERGCSKSYNILLNKTSKESMEYLQDFLLAKECSEYNRPPVTRLSKGKNSTAYLVRLGSNDKRYEVTIRHNNYDVSAFEISKYTKKDKIKAGGK